MSEIGVIFRPDLAPERLRPIVASAERAGLAELWLWEDCFQESGIATAAAVLAWSENLRVGIGLLPVPLRNVALSAMEIATLCRLFPGRLRVGVGHGVQTWMHQVGAAVASPLGLLEEYVVALRALLAGERVSVAGRYVQLADVALGWPPAEPPPILCGAVGVRTLELAGRVADGAILVGGTPPAGIAAARATLRAARAATGRSGQPEIVAFVHAATGPSAEARLSADYVRWGYTDTSDIGVSGDAEAFAAGVGRFAAAGSTTVAFLPTPDDPDPEGFAAFLGAEVGARLAPARPAGS